LVPDIPVKRYKQETRPNRGIRERFFRKLRIESTMLKSQKIKVAILAAGAWKK
jgi:hypothetical protein